MWQQQCLNQLIAVQQTGSKLWKFQWAGLMFQVRTHDTELSLCEITRQKVFDCPSIVVSLSLVIKLDCSWMLLVHGHRVDPDLVPSLSKFPSCLDSETTVNLLQTVCSLNTYWKPCI